MDKHTTKILVINLGGLGDQILFFPVLETLKNYFKNSFITFVTEPRSKSLKGLTTLADEVFISNLKSGNMISEALKFLSKARSGNYDVVISSGSSPLISGLLFLTGIKRRIGYKSSFLSQIFLTDPVPLVKKQYASDMYHDLVSKFTGSKEKKISSIEELLNEADKHRIREIIRNDDLKKVVIHPGVSKLSIKKNILKFWKTENWVELILNLLDKYKVILTGGPDDEEVSSRLKTLFLENKHKNFIDLTDKISRIEEFVYVVKISDVLVCVDSAPMHIGVGLKKPIVALFGPTDPEKLLPSDSLLFTAVKREDLECRPCLWDKRQKSCDDVDCLEIEVQEVLKEVEKKL
jgi:ADP-heptose:LPS heptosyltransferase